MMLDRTFITHYENAATKVAVLVKGLTQEDLHATPVPGKWSIQQVVIHLADSEAVFADRMKRIIAEPGAQLLAFDENRWTAELCYAERSAEDAAQLIALTRRQIATILKALPDAAFARQGTHSISGPMTLQAVVEKAASHLDHHVTFIVDKREKLGKLMW